LAAVSGVNFGTDENFQDRFLFATRKEGKRREEEKNRFC